MQSFTISAAIYLLNVFLIGMNIKFAWDLCKPNGNLQEVALVGIVFLIFAILMSIGPITVGAWVVISSILALITIMENTSNGWTFWWKLSVIPTVGAWGIVILAAYRAITQ